MKRYSRESCKEVAREQKRRSLSLSLSHGNCKCNHWNKNWLSSDVKRRVGERRGGEEEETVEEAGAGDRREKYT